MFIKIFLQKNSPYESGGAMVMDFIPKCDMRSSNPHTCNLGSYLSGIVHLINLSS